MELNVTVVNAQRSEACLWAVLLPVLPITEHVLNHAHTQSITADVQCGRASPGVPVKVGPGSGCVLWWCHAGQRGMGHRLCRWVEVDADDVTTEPGELGRVWHFKIG